eukprot:6207772-Pleurochrysis_carterae.AAC.3
MQNFKFAIKTRARSLLLSRARLPPQGARACSRAGLALSFLGVGLASTQQLRNSQSLNDRASRIVGARSIQ